MVEMEYITDLAIVLPNMGEYKPYIQKVRMRFDRRRPTNYGVYDSMRGDSYPLVGGEPKKIIRLAQELVGVGEALYVMVLDPDIITACFSLSAQEFGYVGQQPHLYIGDYEIRQRLVKPV